MFVTLTPVHLAFKIAKLDADQNLVFGYANVSIAKSGDLITDLQDDSIDPTELEKTAYEFVLTSGEADAMHRGPAIGKCVESMVFTPEKLAKLATDPTGHVNQGHLNALTAALPPRWWVGFKLDDKTFAKVKDGTYSMFSIAGEADRVNLEKGGKGSGSAYDAMPFQVNAQDGDKKTPVSLHADLASAHASAQDHSNTHNTKTSVTHRDTKRTISEHMPCAEAA